MVPMQDPFTGQSPDAGQQIQHKSICRGADIGNRESRKQITGVEMKSVVSVLAVLSLFNLVACVEVMDKDDLKGEVVVKEIRNLVIDEPYFLVDGDFVPARRLTNKPNAEMALLGDRQTYALSVDVLTFTDKGVLFTMGQDVRISARVLESQNGWITTFPADHEARLVADGVSGGNISLQVERASGSLNLVMQGERGGVGLTGGDPHPSMDGKSFPLPRPMNGFGCTQPKEGAPGGLGARGGISGSAHIEILDGEGFVLNAKASPGLGGRGGPGGAGGRYCMGSHKRGPSGATGPVGAEGTVQTICVKRGSRELQCK
ncbi:hypothetical protein [Bdellovibrio sp. GT3]|uniref:hypothetical protein n=1 Tax=Bdellovibrio sp. GT3 TaxID=3136282 RepID=UPI0030F368D7